MKRLLLPATAYVAFVVLFHLLIVATPGFRSHDEWNVYDEIAAHGMLDYLAGRLELRAGAHLGVPVAPVGFVQIGVLAPFMASLPMVTHLFDVLHHAAVGLLLVATIARASGSSTFAWLTGLAFAISPLAAPSTGWTAASFDRWSTLFLLMGALVLTAGSAKGKGRWSLPLMIIVATLAILSKLTSVVLPAVLLVTIAALRWLPSRAKVDTRHATLLVATACLPLLAYFAIRFPALASSAGGATSTYSPSLNHIPANLVVAASYPFLPDVVEPHRVAAVDGWLVALALLVHLALVAVLWRAYGWRAALLYVAAYLVYLAPVLVLPTLAGQYFYGSAVALAVGVAAVWLWAMRERRRLVQTFVAALVVILIAHQLTIQIAINHTGLCQSRFMNSLDAALASHRSDDPPTISIIADRGAPTNIARRALVRRAYRLHPTSIQLDASVPARQLVMTTDCLLHEPPAVVADTTAGP